MRKNYKPMIIGILCALIVVMAVGFALLREQLTINGTSHIDSNWNIRITNISVQDTHSIYNTNPVVDNEASGDCTTRTNGACDSTSANFNVSLQSPGDYIIYRVTVTNSGTLDGVVESIDLSNESNSNTAIQVTKEGLDVGDKILKTNGTNTVDIKVMYNPNVETQPNNLTATITLTINYQQDLGQIAAPFTGTGTIYRYYTNRTTQTLSLNQNIESYLSNDSYTSEWSTNPSDFNSINYLKHEVSNYVITASYACFIADDTEHCMQGGKDTNNQSYYSTNVGILQGVQSWFTAPAQGGTCNINASGSSSFCNGAGFDEVNAYSYGDVFAIASGVDCYVNDHDLSYCSR